MAPLRLLLVEDDEVQVALLKKSLAGLTDFVFEIDDVQTLAEAQDLLDQRAWDLVVTDLALPDAEGISTLDGLLSHANDLPIVVMSGAPDPELPAKCLARGAQGFLNKHDVTDAELRRVVQQSILRKEYLAEVILGLSRDAITGALERGAFTRLLTATHRAGAAYSLLYFDIDSLKNINDTFGHRVGDQVLIDMVARIRESIRDEDTIGRWGGDEFIVLAPGSTDIAELRTLAIRVGEAANSVVARGPGIEARVGVSCGAVLANPQDDLDGVVDAADHAMYAAKVAADGMPHFAMLGGSANEILAIDSSRPTHLPIARLLSEVEFWYQPIMDLSRQRVWGYESLARWPNDESGSTAHNLTLLLESPLAVAFGAHTLQTTCMALTSRLAPGSPDTAISINLHASQLVNTEPLLATMDTLFSELVVSGSQVQLEVTDAGKLRHHDDMVTTLRELRDRGVQIAIDDFCDGYSTFATLMAIPVDGIKIDRSVTSRLPTDRMAARIVRSMVSMCADGSIHLIAEGIETEDQRDRLLDAGVWLQQGYLHGRPTSMLADPESVPAPLAT